MNLSIRLPPVTGTFHPLVKCSPAEVYPTAFFWDSGPYSLSYTWNSLCSSGWPHICSDPSASASQALGSQVWASSSCLLLFLIYWNRLTIIFICSYSTGFEGCQYQAQSCRVPSKYPTVKSHPELHWLSGWRCMFAMMAVIKRFNIAVAATFVLHGEHVIRNLEAFWWACCMWSAKLGSSL